MKEGNTGYMHFGPKYEEKHFAIWNECDRVLAKGGLLICNVSNFIRKGEVVDVVRFHELAIKRLRYHMREQFYIKTPRMGFGANGNVRVEEEVIFVFVKE